MLITGRNGIGKTTLLRQIAGFHRFDAGKISCDAGKVLFLGERNALKAQLTVSENLAFWSGLYEANMSPSAYDRFALDRIAMKLAGELSTGQKRRVALARMFIEAPAVLIFDEPLNALDAEFRTKFTEQLAEQLKGGAAAILTTHQDFDLTADFQYALEDYLPSAPSSPSRDTDFVREFL